jgi:hypothetical protein
MSIGKVHITYLIIAVLAIARLTSLSGYMSRPLEGIETSHKYTRALWHTDKDPMAVGLGIANLQTSAAFVYASRRAYTSPFLDDVKLALRIPTLDLLGRDLFAAVGDLITTRRLQQSIMKIPSSHPSPIE